jgi:hypothetical protein
VARRGNETIYAEAGEAHDGRADPVSARIAPHAHRLGAIYEPVPQAVVPGQGHRGLLGETVAHVVPPLTIARLALSKNDLDGGKTVLGDHRSLEEDGTRRTLTTAAQAAPAR